MALLTGYKIVRADPDPNVGGDAIFYLKNLGTGALELLGTYREMLARLSQMTGSTVTDPSGITEGIVRISFTRFEEVYGFVPSLSPTPGTTDDAEEVDYLGMATMLFPYLPQALIEAYADAWAEYGRQDVALAAMRQNAQYDQWFPGNQREDGTVRMSELEYLSLMDSYATTLRTAGVNPQVFQSQFVSLLEGDVSAEEFRSRIDTITSRVLLQEEAIREVYSTYYGIELNTGAIVASLIDPNMGKAILEQTISVAEIGGEAALAGFDISRATSLRLQQAGLGQTRAQELFQRAANMVPVFSRAGYRQGEGVFGLDQFLGAEVFGTPTALSQMRRILAGEASDFSEQALLQQSETGALTGLIAR